MTPKSSAREDCVSRILDVLAAGPDTVVVRCRHLPLHQPIEPGAALQLLTVRQAGFHHDGRRLRNGMAHGQSTHTVGAACPVTTNRDDGH
ncbi:hypothetical protein AMK16_25920 [Streptomyces sp. CB00455]|uniref:hypothetical protein n=1 Tax=Streptomyces sp. CB00455 TaxID=1703927 RepID=UPI000938BAA1|nr:hypothetical protein [Streptomyces sp. CB00455]OKK16144.1 hypothetical protein AMK16_25920 [Streptomyces sp. CB00455]